MKHRNTVPYTNHLIIQQVVKDFLKRRAREPMSTMLQNTWLAAKIVMCDRNSGSSMQRAKRLPRAVVLLYKRCWFMRCKCLEGIMTNLVVTWFFAIKTSHLDIET